MTRAMRKAILLRMRAFPTSRTRTLNAMTAIIPIFIAPAARRAGRMLFFLPRPAQKQNPSEPLFKILIKKIGCHLPSTSLPLSTEKDKLRDPS